MEIRVVAVFFLILGIALATDFKNKNVEYQYIVTGRTLTGLPEVADQFSGILYKAKLRIQPIDEGKLAAQIDEAKMSKIHAHLAGGWETDIQEAELSWENIGMTGKPFEVELKSGVIRGLVMSATVPNWELNIIKGIMSQFQLDTKASQYISSHLNDLPHDLKRTSAVFKTMEETITGNTETLYQIHPLTVPAAQFESNNVEQQYQHKSFEVIRHKNYTNSVSLPAYSFGYGAYPWSPAMNKGGSFFVRDSYSRAVLTGNLDRHILRNSYTVNKIAVNPTLSNQQKGLVVSAINVTLQAQSSIQQRIGEDEQQNQPLILSSLVFNYDTPSLLNGGIVEEDQDPEDLLNLGMMRQRLRRSLPQLNDQKRGYGCGLLPCIVVKKHVDPVKAVQDLAIEIGNEMNDPMKILVENSMDKVSMLTSLIRFLTVDDIQKASSWLYPQSGNRSKQQAWQIFYQAVAQAGTAPAFVNIQNWISSQKVTSEEASEMISIMVKAAPSPDLEYLREYFDFIQTPVVESQWPLNGTALLSFGSLIHKALIQSMTQSSVDQPDVQEIKSFLDEKVIPHFSAKLEKSITRGETEKTHTYIRTLGNIARPKIISAFEPYLEGSKQCSQFQRLLMVIALDKIVPVSPVAARSVLFKIYQNPDEMQEIRVAAVYNLIKTNPPSDMMQLMASYTNIDTHEHVNAAVKGLIERRSRDHAEDARYPALSALPLLTKKMYGAQHGGFMLRKYSFQNLNTAVHERSQFYGSEDSLLPKGVHYRFDAELNGLKQRITEFQMFVTSIDELVHVAENLSSEHVKKQEQQQARFEEQLQNKWSSQNIARVLNLQLSEQEQLEGHLFLEHSRLLAFDNNTIGNIPEIVRKLEESYRNGVARDYTKLSFGREIAVSFPTEMGFPFIFTYNNPTIYSVSGDVKATAEPQMYQRGKLNLPEKVFLNTNLTITVTNKVEGRLSFFTQFDNQQYISGYDKHMQVHVPVKSDVEIDVRQSQVKAEFQIKENHNNAKLFHYSTWPYTSSKEIVSFRALAGHPNTQIIQQQNLHSFDRIIGAKQAGAALHVQIHHEKEFIPSSDVWQLIQAGRVPELLSTLWNDGPIQYSQLNVSLVPQDNKPNKFVIKLGYQEQYAENAQSGEGMDWKQYNDETNPMVRQQKLMDKVSSGIKHVRASAYDASLKVEGETSIEHTVTLAHAKSSVDPKSCLIMYYKRTSSDEEVKPYGMSFEASSLVPNTNDLDLEYSLGAEPKMNAQIDFRFGSTEELRSRVQAKVEYRRSENRKEFLKRQPQYRLCQNEIQEGNEQMFACVNMTMEANLLDSMTAKIKYENLDEKLQRFIQAGYNNVRILYLPSIEENWNEKCERNEMIVEARFDGDLRSANVSVKTEDMQTTMKDIPVDKWTRAVVVPHPSYHMRNRLLSRVFGLPTFRVFCTVDQNKASSFNNREFPIELRNFWTVMFQYVPKHARQGQHSQDGMKSQNEHFAILVRKSSKGKNNRDVKLTLSSPRTDFKVVDITLTPKEDSDRKATVAVNGQTVEVSGTSIFNMYEDYIQIYTLPNGEVKVGVLGHFYILYDGKRVRVDSRNGKFRNSIVGLCGPMNDEPSEDFLTSQSCYARDPSKFLKSFELEGDEGKRIRSQFEGKNNDCVQKVNPRYTNVVSDQDAQRFDQVAGTCTRIQTGYIEENGRICFTTRPVLSCDKKCQPTDLSLQNVPVHCITRTNVAQLWKEQIDQGVRRDFSHKKPTKTVVMQIPESCI